ncbi:hypothetical protein B0T10DRAFT_533164 [Thelonectria olida]|uniref:Agmatine deiminase n=1 Tax=Thelonectria olida TaxID=1576542 RepID=A0A9P8VRF0_9HYPO|nr:hypothetical protein B0T10DRAFT_533164 [Thelonectria olida]
MPLDTPKPSQSYSSSSHASQKTYPNARYVMPPEWAPHSRTMTVWPDFSSIPDHAFLNAARQEVSAIATAIARFEPVTMYTRPENVEAAQATVSRNVSVVGLEEARQLWVRDTGPIVVKDVSTSRSAGLGLNFNYWGAKLPREGDEFVAERILSGMDLSLHSCPFQAEGGAIEVDGEGTLLATESSILNTNRNPDVNKQQMERHFHNAFGVRKTIWLPGVKGYDMTDYHIDAFVRFIKPGAVILSKPPGSAEQVTQDAYEEAKYMLDRESDAVGRQLQVFEVNEPDLGDIPGSEFGETVASYVNYLVVNGGLIIPRFGVASTDEDALATFRKCFPGREIVQVHLNALPNMGGGIHCATQQVPA